VKDEAEHVARITVARRATGRASLVLADRLPGASTTDAPAVGANPTEQRLDDAALIARAQLVAAFPTQEHLDHRS
jgi:hypothetical protein